MNLLVMNVYERREEREGGSSRERESKGKREREREKMI